MKSPNIKWLPSGEPYSENFNDIYFSQQNGLAETRYVFLEGNDLTERFKSHHGIFRIAETGFGTGLNFLAAWQLVDQANNPNLFLDFVSVEKYPLSKAVLLKALSVWTELSDYSERLANAYPDICYSGTVQIQMAKNVLLTLIFDDATEAYTNYQHGVDAWFLDGFAPSQNSAMWSFELFEQVARLSGLNHNTSTFATFTAASQVRKGLIEAGFDVKKRKGFGKKREMLCGSVYIRTQKKCQQPIPPYYEFPNHNIEGNDKVAIIGAGLAGCSIAYEFSKYDIQCDIFDKEQEIAGGASGNPVGISHPYLSMDGNISDLFFTQGFLQLRSFLKTYATQDVFHLQSMYQVLETDQKAQFYQKLIVNRELNEELVQFLSSQEVAERLNGFDGIHSVVLYPQALAVNPKALCHLLLKLTRAYVNCYLGVSITKLEKINENWEISFSNRPSKTYKSVILAGGYSQFEEFDFLSYMNCLPKPGQVDVIDNPGIHDIITNKNYFVPLNDNDLLIGATFRHGCDQLNPTIDDFKQNMNGLPVAIIDQNKKPKYGRVSTRCTSMDHLPVIGGVVNPTEFETVYQQNLKNGVTANHLGSCPYQDGLYIASSFGSKGLSASMISAQILRSLVLGHSLPCDSSIYKALHPSRFLVRSYKKNIL